MTTVLGSWVRVALTIAVGLGCGNGGTTAREAPQVMDRAGSASDTPAASVGSRAGGAASAAGVSWVHVFGGGDADDVYGLAIVPEGVVAVGTFYQTITAPAGRVASRGDADMFVARLRGNGETQWLRGFGSPKADFAWSVAAIGDVAVIGAEADGTVDLDGAATRTAAQAELDANPPIVFALDAAGKRSWLRTFDSEESGAVRAVAAAGDELVIGGRTTGRANRRDLGAGVLSCDQGAAFVARTDAHGAVRWARCSKSNTNRAVGGGVVERIAIARDGGVAACGAFGGTLSFGAGAVEHDGVLKAVFVATFGPDGAPRVLVNAVGQQSDASCTGIVTLEDGSVIVATSADGTLGGHALPDGAVVALDATGAVRWVIAIGQLAGVDRGSALAIAIDGTKLWIAADVAVRKRPGQTVLMAIDAATGKPVGTPRELDQMFVRAIAVGEQLYLAGHFENRLTLAGKRYDSAGKHAAIIVALPR